MFLRGEDHVQRRPACPPAAAARWVPPAPGIRPELDLGEAQLGGLVVGADAAVAGQGQLQPAAEAGAVDRGDHRDLHRLELVQHLLAVAAELPRRPRRS